MARSKVKVTWRSKLEILPFSKSISFAIFRGSYWAGFLMSILVFVSRDFGLGRTWLAGVVDHQTRTVLNFIIIIVKHTNGFSGRLSLLWYYSNSYLVCRVISSFSLWHCGTVLKTSVPSHRTLGKLCTHSYIAGFSRASALEYRDIIIIIVISVAVMILRH